MATKKGVSFFAPAEYVNVKGAYFTHFNGGRPFYVEIKSADLVKIYIDFEEKEIVRKEGGVHKNQLLKKGSVYMMVCNPLKIWIGKDSNFGPEFGDGNSILLQLTSDKYMCILHEEVFTFQSKSNIVDYYSPIGNSDVVYSYAVTNDGQVVIFDDNVVFFQYEKDGSKNDPWDDYEDVPVNLRTMVLKQVIAHGKQ